jgi:hypothetical protein
MIKKYIEKYYIKFLNYEEKYNQILAKLFVKEEELKRKSSENKENMVKLEGKLIEARETNLQIRENSIKEVSEWKNKNIELQRKVEKTEEEKIQIKNSLQDEVDNIKQRNLELERKLEECQKERVQMIESPENKRSEEKQNEELLNTELFQQEKQVLFDDVLKGDLMSEEQIESSSSNLFSQEKRVLICEALTSRMTLRDIFNLPEFSMKYKNGKFKIKNVQEITKSLRDYSKHRLFNVMAIMKEKGCEDVSTLIEYFTQRADDSLIDQKFENVLEILQMIAGRNENKEEYQEMLKKYGETRITVQKYKEKYFAATEKNLTGIF